MCPRRSEHQPPTPEPSTLPSIVCLGREAMASPFEIQFADGTMDRSLALRAFDHIDAIEQQLTVYRTDSDVSAINRAAGQQPVVVETRLFDLIVECHRLWVESAGAFDVTAGPLIKTWGFFRRQGRLPTEEEISAALAKVGTQHLRLDRRERTIQMTQPGMEINFGSIGKGYALDRVADWLGQRGVRSVLLGAGNSSIRAVGSRPGETGWPIAVADPGDRSRPFGQLWLRDESLSMSGSTEQFFEHEGKRYSHILDPRTGWPAEGMRQVLVIAPTAARAEALSTAISILGIDWARDYTSRNPEIKCIIFPDAPHAAPIILGKPSVDSESLGRFVT